jgi:hypothetical protein
MKILLDYWGGDPAPHEVADEMKRVADLIEQDYTSGELVAGPDRGWWTLTEGDD